MNIKLKIFLQVIFWFFPWSIRRRFMNSLFGFRIHKTAKIGKAIILCDELIMEEKSNIKDFTFVKNINKLEIGYNSRINVFNFITGINMKYGKFLYDKDSRCELIIGKNSRITSRHFLDCNGGIYIGDFTTIAGSNTQFLSHSVNVHINRQTAGKIVVGNHCFVSTSCILLKGSRLPDNCVLAAGSVLNKSFDEEGALYGGVPTKKIKDFDVEKTLYFNRLDADVS